MVVRRWGVQQGQLYARNYFPNDMKKLYHKDTKRTGDLVDFFFLFVCDWVTEKKFSGWNKNPTAKFKWFQWYFNFFLPATTSEKKITENLYWQNSEYGINARGKINGKFILKIKKNSYRCICGDAFRRRISLILRWKEKKRRCIEDSERRLSRQQTCIAKQGVTNSEVFSRARITTCTSGNLRHL